LTRWPVFVDHFTHFLEKSMVRNWISNSVRVFRCRKGYTEMSVKQSSKLIAVITTGLKAAPKPVQLWFALIMNLSA
ncbi:hypothetical protein, partial [Shigella sonnei]